ncbi:kxDL motif-containing protein 1 isoform 1-T2 [Rhynchonycteris naso]
MDPPDSASRVFCSRILSMVNVDDINAIILAQKNMLDRFEKTNEMLVNFNNLSSVRLQQMSERFVHHTRTLVEMKRDLDSIFRRIRTLKGKLARQHPEAFSPSFPQIFQRHPSWRMMMKTPFCPARLPPSPPQNRAQVPVTPAQTPSHPPSVLASRTHPTSSPTLLPSMAIARWTTRRCWASNPASKCSEGVIGLSRCLRWQWVWVTLPQDSQLCYPILSSRTPWGTSLHPSGMEFQGGSVIPTPSLLSTSLSYSLCQAEG